MNSNASEKQNGAWPWRPALSSYRNEEISVLTFESKQEAYRALDFRWEKLFGMPHSLPGYNAVVVPADAVHYFSEAGLKFAESKLLTVTDLTPEELEEYRNRRR